MESGESELANEKGKRGGVRGDPHNGFEISMAAGRLSFVNNTVPTRMKMLSLSCSTKLLVDSMKQSRELDRIRVEGIG